MKPILLILLTGMLAWSSLRAADTPAPDFPVVGATYFFEYAIPEYLNDGKPARRYPVVLRILKVLPSGWIYASRVEATLEPDPADPAKTVESEKVHSPAWYNLQTFAEASEVKGSK